MKPIVLVNFKTYVQGTGKKALRLAKIIEKVSKDYDAEFVIAVQPTDIKEISKNVSIKVFAENIEDQQQGQGTGHVIAESVKDAGAVGTLINHSEYQVGLDKIENLIKKAKSLNLKSVVCANDVNIAGNVAKFEPDFIAVEPPELIGGKISVAEAKPEVIENAVKKIKGNVLVGAGINKAEDLRTSLRLGAKGILLASAIVKAGNPEKALRNLLQGLN
jgi:triosephosphate isomerase (TIM)